MSDHYNKDIKSIFKLDSPKNIADKLLNGPGDPNMVGGSGALGLIGGVLGGAVKTIGRLGGGFANTAKQYMRGGRALKPTGNFKPLVTGNKVHNTESINQAFAQRFGRPQNVVKKATEGKDALTHLKKVKKMARNAGPKESIRSLTESAKKRTNFTSGR